MARLVARDRCVADIMTAATVSLSQTDVYTAIRAFILGLISCEVIDGLDNSVPPPQNPFIAITALFSNRLRTNIDTFAWVAGAGVGSIEQGAMYTVQIDCYGPLSSNWASIIATMFRDQYGVDHMTADVVPLYTKDPMQLPIVDAEALYEQRWMIEACVQYNPVVTVPQQACDVAKVGLINVDATYPT
jgi:hypothetical protein